MSSKLVFVLYDGIQNSVFESQVIKPLADRCENDSALRVALISFERQQLQAAVVAKYQEYHAAIKLVIVYTWRFFGTISLYKAVRQLIPLLQNHQFDQMIARGPLAGWIVIEALKRLQRDRSTIVSSLYAAIDCIIQARGLCAEEYRFTAQFKNNWLGFIGVDKIRYHQFFSIERRVYGTKNIGLIPVRIEAVSEQLKDYLIKTFHADANSIFIAKLDIPKEISSTTVQQWRQVVRQELDIKMCAKVYCYSGSARPWQCATETLAYFYDLYKKNNNLVLLILTPDAKHFRDACHSLALPSTSYCIVKAKPADVYRYLAAADCGMLFRHNDVINWVSRPTKVLEYEAVGLEVIHNQTVGWLVARESSAMTPHPRQISPS